jgi:uncharacterized protein YecE (DUF72 family)
VLGISRADWGGVATKGSSKGVVEIGCGSWSDDDYIGVLYPKGLPGEHRLNCYATWFNQVEVNSSYYATPKREMVARWVEQTPASFRFTIKLHRAFSRSPAKVAAEGRLLLQLLKGVQPLIKADKLGAFLLVMAPTFAPEKHDLSELDDLAQQLKPHVLAVELRHTGWVKGKTRAATLAYFRKRGLAWVAVDMPRVKDTSVLPPIDEVTNPSLAYLRLHGRNKDYLNAKSAAERHTFEYGPRELKEIVSRIHTLASAAKRVCVVANNHARDFAPKTALALKCLLGENFAIAAKRNEVPVDGWHRSLT